MILSAWFHVSPSENPIGTAISHYVSQGWSVSNKICCDATLSARPALSMLDLMPHERVRCSETGGAQWLIEAEVTRLQHGKRGKRENRLMRFGRSSIACSWSEHPVEIDLAEGSGERTGRRELPHAAQLREARAFCDATKPAWALLTEHGRGPSLPELKGPVPPETVDIHAVFLGQSDFGEGVVNDVGAVAHSETWSYGTFFSSSEALDAGSCMAFTLRVWKTLTQWSRKTQFAR
ncbi:MAG: hypothetical protein IPN58_17570 [Anaerolineales bacterium]|nr:hypothetical protein [Anaerolineales bacterium]